MYNYNDLQLVAGASKAALDPKTGRNVPDTSLLVDGTVINSNDSAGSTPARRLAVVGAQAAAAGLRAVIGNSGSIAVHFVAFTNGQALIMQRPAIPNPNPDLQVCTSIPWGTASSLQCLLDAAVLSISVVMSQFSNLVGQMRLQAFGCSTFPSHLQAASARAATNPIRAHC